MTTPTLIEKTIPIGWTAFCDISEKKVYGYREFTTESKAKTALTLVSAKTESELKTELSKRGINLFK
jgi:hypothetical protein